MKVDNPHNGLKVFKNVQFLKAKKKYFSLNRKIFLVKH